MNRVFLIGRLTKEPELRHTTNGTACCQIRLAVNRPKQKDKEQEADFINVVVWDKQAENLAKYKTKGSQIAVEGSIRTRTYEDDEKKKVYVTEVLALNVMYLDSKKDNKETQEDSTNEQQETTEPVNDPFAEFGERIEAEQLDLPF
ncbi:MAG: single-stranded DNA-binding protein [Methanosphaera sp.]|nr:single-stranded DNA-binding protein [Methanosphaera sp.]